MSELSICLLAWAGVMALAMHGYLASKYDHNNARAALMMVIAGVFIILAWWSA